MDITKSNVFDLSKAIDDLEIKRKGIALRKQELEMKLSNIKNKIRSDRFKMPQQEYKLTCDRQEKYKKEIVDLQSSLNVLKDEMAKKQTLKFQLKHETGLWEADIVLKERITELRDKYM